jgi:hypothetical protein
MIFEPRKSDVSLAELSALEEHRNENLALRVILDWAGPMDTFGVRRPACGDENRIGFGLQVATVRASGLFLADPLDVFTEAVDVGVADPSKGQGGPAAGEDPVRASVGDRPGAEFADDIVRRGDVNAKQRPSPAFRW